MWYHTEIDVEESRRLADMVPAAPRDCWRNAWRALPLLPVGALYVEGWVVYNGLAIEHGWCEHPAGVVVDPTLALNEDWPGAGGAVYFPGERYTLQRAVAVGLESQGVLPLVWRNGWGGFDHPPYRAALDSAWEYATNPALHLCSSDNNNGPAVIVGPAVLSEG